MPFQQCSDSNLQTSPWQWWRDQMPITRRWAYLDHAAVAPLPACAQQRMVAFADEAAESGTTVWPQWSKGIEEFRKRLADWINASEREIALIPNTSFGISLVAEGFDWQPGDNVLIVDGDFPSNRLAWENQASKGVEVRSIPVRDGAINLDDIDNLIDENTRIVSVSWVGYATGFRLDLGTLTDLVHRRGALLFVDAIQGMGIYPIDVRTTPIDFMAADGHKWMLGPEGAGFAYIRSEHIERLRCTSVGWHSVVNSHDFANAELRLRNDAARFEAGSANMVGLLCFAESARVFEQVIAAHGADAISERVLALAKQAAARLEDAGASVMTKWPAGHNSSILVFNVPGVKAASVRSVGLSQDVVLSCRGGGVRASIHAYNDNDDIDRLLRVVEQVQS